MFGALLLSSPPEARNRRLFKDLITENRDHMTSTNLDLLLMATVAQDSLGHRIKIGSTCAPWDTVPLEAVDPFPDSLGQGHTPPDPYAARITDSPCDHEPPAPDVLAYGSLTMHSVPSRGLGLYSSLEGRITDSPEPWSHVPPSILDILVEDDDPDANFVTKARRDVLDKLNGRYVAQIVSAGPDPFLVLLRRERPTYLSFVETDGCFYLVWSDFELKYRETGHRPYVWPLLTFEQGDPHLILGFSIRMLRNRWVRWLTPKQPPRRIEDVDVMRVPRSIAALQQWLLKRTA